MIITDKSKIDWNKYEVILNWGDDGREYLNEDEYTDLMSGIRTGQTIIIVGKGKYERTFFPSRFILIRSNTGWYDPAEARKKRQEALANRERIRQKYETL